MGLFTIHPITKNGMSWSCSAETSTKKYSKRNNWPKISIITPSYNQGQFIEETIRSVLLQNYPNLEYIIIDGGSTDNTVEIIKKYEKWITYWVSEPDNGQSHAINKGIARCTGEIFNWINSDDFYTPNSLYTIASNFINGDYDIVAGFNNRFIEQNGVYTTTSKVRLEISDEVEKTIFFLSYRQTPTFYKLDIIKKLGSIREDLNFVMDTELFIRYLFKFGQEKILFLDDLIANYRLHETSKTVSLQIRFQEELFKIHETIKDAATEKNQNVGITKYDLSKMNNVKLIAYYYAFRALFFPRKNVINYMKFIWMSFFYFPNKKWNHALFLLNDIILYRKGKSDF